MSRTILNALAGTAVLLLMSSVSGCGFQLRGSEGFQIDSVYVKSTQADLSSAAIKQRLMERGLTVTALANEAEAVVHLSNEAVDRRVLTVSSISGKLEEIELKVRVDFEALTPQDEVLLPKQTLRLYRDYSYDETAVLAMGEEETVIQQELYREIVAQIMRRIAAIRVE